MLHQAVNRSGTGMEGHQEQNSADRTHGNDDDR